MFVIVEFCSRYFKKKSLRERERGNRNMCFFFNIVLNWIVIYEKEGGLKKLIDLFYYNVLISEVYK